MVSTPCRTLLHADTVRTQQSCVTTSSPVSDIDSERTPLHPPLLCLFTKTKNAPNYFLEKKKGKKNRVFDTVVVVMVVGGRVLEKREGVDRSGVNLHRIGLHWRACEMLVG